MKYSDIISPVLTDKEIIEKLYNECEIEPYLFYTNINKFGFEKNIKIIDPNWFLSLLPDYDESTYNFIEKKMNVALDRECTFIPFP